MTLYTLSIRRPVLAIVMSITIVLFGLLGFSFLGVREYPSLDPPNISVSTSYRGASADVIESQITEPIEAPTRTVVTVDGNEAAASVAYRTNEILAIYPITPSSPMGELADAWSNQNRPNVWGNIPEVIEMQKEAVAAGTAHSAIQGGALTSTFTAS